MNNSLEPDRSYGDPGFTQFIGVSLTFIPKDIGFTGDDQRFGQSTELFQTGPKR
ncbi:hypothetical protein D3C81_1965870 [compost metagenome]